VWLHGTTALGERHRKSAKAADWILAFAAETEHPYARRR
jgi:hypothetical protein